LIAVKTIPVNTKPEIEKMNVCVHLLKVL